MPDAHVAYALRTFAAHYHVADPRDAMAAACRRLLLETGRYTTERERLDAILSHLNVRVRTGPIPEAGYLDVHRSGYELVLRTSDTPQERLFTIAHELSHIILLEGTSHDQPALHALGGETHLVQVEELCDFGA